MQIKPMDDGALRHVMDNLREWDRREIAAVSFGDGREDMMRNHGSFAFIAHADDGEPVVAIGAVQLWPGMWSPWAVGTNRFRSIARPLTKFVRTQMIPAMQAMGFRRAECHSMVGHTESHQWLMACGGTPEMTSRAYGKNGEDFVMFAWYNTGQSGQLPVPEPK